MAAVAVDRMSHGNNFNRRKEDVDSKDNLW